MQQFEMRGADTLTQMPKLGRGVGRAHGKAILFGEHAVVYGAPAIAFPVNVLPVTVNATLTLAASTIESELYTGPLERAPRRLAPVVAAIRTALNMFAPKSGAKIAIYSDIPYERGLGSSAAVASAIVEAVAHAAGQDPNATELFDLTQVGERVAHGNPSGMDAHAVQSTQIFRYRKPNVEPIRVGGAFYFVIADTGVPGATREAVAGVARRKAADPRVDAAIGELARVAEESVADFEDGNLAAIGAKMNRAHGLLRTIGVSSPELDHLVDTARRAGAMGAKLTGGGIGGCILALAPTLPEAERIAGVLRGAGAKGAWATWLEPID